MSSFKDSKRYHNTSIKELNLTCDTSFDRNNKLFDSFSPLKSEHNYLFTNTNTYLQQFQNEMIDTNHEYRSGDSLNKLNNLKDE